MVRPHDRAGKIGPARRARPSFCRTPPTLAQLHTHTNTHDHPPFFQASPFSLFLAEELTPLTPSAPVALAAGAPPYDAALASLGGLASPLGAALTLDGLEG